MRGLRSLAALGGVAALAAIAPVGAQAGIGSGSALCVPWSPGDPLLYWTDQEFILQRNQELRWVTVNNPCQGVGTIDIYHNHNKRLDRILFLPGASVTVREAQIKAAGIRTKHLSGFGSSLGPSRDPCDVFGAHRYVADDAGNVTPLVC
jgi:hypothetical protein